MPAPRVVPCLAPGPPHDFLSPNPRACRICPRCKSKRERQPPIRECRDPSTARIAKHYGADHQKGRSYYLWIVL